MGKRTLRTLHYELVASQIKTKLDYFTMRQRYYEERNLSGVLYSGALMAIHALAISFADEFEIRGETFDRGKFLRSCGLEGE